MPDDKIVHPAFAEGFEEFRSPQKKIPFATVNQNQTHICNKPPGPCYEERVLNFSEDIKNNSNVSNENVNACELNPITEGIAIQTSSIYSLNKDSTVCVSKLPAEGSTTPSDEHTFENDKITALKNVTENIHTEDLSSPTATNSIPIKSRKDTNTFTSPEIPSAKQIIHNTMSRELKAITNDSTIGASNTRINKGHEICDNTITEENFRTPDKPSRKRKLTLH